MQLIISEKPAAAAKIAAALGKAERKTLRKVVYYEVPSKKIIVVPAVGHLFTLSQKEKGYNYPIFDLEWKPSFEVSKSSAFSKPYFENLKALSKKADEFVIATDYDIEGEVIGYNILRFICGQKDAKRMKFSTLTKTDLVKSYGSVMKTIDWGQAEAGLTRHYLDWYWGVNLTKAATDSVYTTTHRFKVLSIGRVQGPALSLLAERELEIRNFKPEPFWQIFINLTLDKEKFQAVHEKEKFNDKQEAAGIFNKIKDKDVIVKSLDKRKQKVSVCVPFDLTTLQTEAHRVFRMSPKNTLSTAQSLYEKGLVSYPRTSSQKLPPSLGLKKVLMELSRQTGYGTLVKKIFEINKDARPNEGKKTDPAHPAIYPTGEIPKRLNSYEKKVYDLIVKRFLGVFGEEGLRESTKVMFEVEKEDFVLHGIRTVEMGWQEFYWPYSKKKEVELPELKVGETYRQKSQFDEKETQPPKRYTDASIIKKLEKENLGTKATRAHIIETLKDRGYTRGEPIEVTALGLKVIEVFSKSAPDILDENLTRQFEDDMEKIREGKLKREVVLKRAKEILMKLFEKFDKHKTDIGKELSEALYTSERRAKKLMTCPKCGKGVLRIVVSKRTHKRFLACDAYPNCKTTWPLPQKGKLTITKVKCPDCDTPKISVKAVGRRVWQFCPNMECPGRKKLAEKKAAEKKKKKK